MKKSALVAIALMAAAAPAMSQNVKPENQIKFRRAAYTIMNLNFASLEAMVESKKPYNKDEAVRNADIVSLLSSIPRNYFGEGTDKDTRAKPEIWKNRADFDAKMDKMVGEAGKLPAVARGGDTAALRKQVQDLGQACKACHDEYRAKQQ